MMRMMVVRACSGELRVADGGEMVIENSMDSVRISGAFSFSRQKRLNLRTAWSGIGGCYGKASSQSPPSCTPKCVMINGVGCVMWGMCMTSAEG